MKRIISLILVSLLGLSVFFCLAGCGKVNKSEVAILWRGDASVADPNSLINSMERAMYINKVEYKHYGANYDVIKQYDQAKEALDNGAQVLVVELVNQLGSVVAGDSLARQIIDAAKAKDVPVIFFNSIVEKNVVQSYDKCALVMNNESSKEDVLGELIADYIKNNFKDIDKNEDNVISAFSYSASETAVKKANELLAKDDYLVKRSFFGEKIKLTIDASATDAQSAEIIITKNDTEAYLVLDQIKDLVKKGEGIPIFTIGESFDYKALILKDRPEIPEDLIINENDKKSEIKEKDKKIMKLESIKEHYAKYEYIYDFSTVKESDLNEMILNTLNVIDAGKISGTAIADKDAMSLAVATIVKNLCKGEDMFANVASKIKEDEEQSVTVNGPLVTIRYTTYISQ